MYVIMIHWTIVSIFTLLGLAGYMFYKGTYKMEEYEKTEICIISKASKNVRDSLFGCIRHNSNMFKRYRLYVVIDEESESKE